MRVAIIGAGFYGLHLADSLINLGIETHIYEKESNILSMSSGNNQFRLHLGFHYARNFRTREQSREGYYKFIEKYGHLTKKVEKNFYLVPKGNSLLDFQTYKMIMMSSGLSFTECDLPNEISHECGCIKTDERIICIKLFREFFTKKLKNNLFLNKKITIKNNIGNSIVDGKIYDYVINCTWGHLDKKDGFYFEATILLYYKLKNINNADKAWTFVDGNLCSIYPTENKLIYTLSSVLHTPLIKSKDLLKVKNFLNNINEKIIQEKRFKMEKEIRNFYKNFTIDFEYIRPQLSIKTKPIGDDDDRSCYVFKKDRTISILSGKIDNIFYATSETLALLS